MIRILVAIALGFALIGGAGTASAADHAYVGVKKCKSCHKKALIGDQYGEWKKMSHAEAFKTLKEDKAIELAKEKGISGPPHKAPECLKCHVTGYDVDAKLLPKKGLKEADGVQCESCHGPGKDYRKKKIMSDRDKSIAKGMWEPGSPSWDPAKYELADGSKVGFDHELAMEEIAHPIPEDVKGKYLEVEKKLKAERKARGESDEDEDEEDEDDE
jgi:hypothetical protein